MKAITLHQPWASLFAVGAKTIETRSWSASYRGLLIIHAGLRVQWGPIGEYLCEPWWDAENVRHVDECECGDGVAPACARRSPSRPVLTLGGEWFMDLPLGAVVASCVLADVVPIVKAHSKDLGSDEWPLWPYAADHGWIQLGDEWLNMKPMLHRPPTVGQRDGWISTDITDQIPFGDYSTDEKQRYAWLLEDGKPTAGRCPWCWGIGAEPATRNECRLCDGAGALDPITAKGRQGLWDWEPSR